MVEQDWELTADIAVRAPPGIEFRVEHVGIHKDGSFRDATGTFEVVVGATLGELRKLALASDALHELVRAAELEPDDAPALLRLRASPKQLKRLARAAKLTGEEPTADDLALNDAWVQAALMLQDYEPQALVLLEGEPDWRR